jgi:hypothetical protein
LRCWNLWRKSDAHEPYCGRPFTRRKPWQS